MTTNDFLADCSKLGLRADMSINPFLRKGGEISSWTIEASVTQEHDTSEATLSIGRENVPTEEISDALEKLFAEVERVFATPSAPQQERRDRH